MWWLILMQAALALLMIFSASVHYLHMLQLESYQTDGYLRHLKRQSSEWKGWTLICGIVCAVAPWVLLVASSMFTGNRSDAYLASQLLNTGIFVIWSFVNIYRDHRAPKKKPIVFTKRMKRLCAVHAGVLAALLFLFILIFGYYPSDSTTKWRLTLLSPYALMALCPWLIILSARAAKPIEDRINRGFFESAAAKLSANKKLIKIGITGSYGKTGTKFALATILSVKYKVLTSESSVNTPMGLSKLINTKLEDSHEVFIAEMGARHTGDIKELTQLVRPSVGLITSIGPQHLETFGNVETVAKTKFELIEALPKNGTGIFASDGAWTDKLYERAGCEKLKSGVGEGEYDMWAENIEVGAFGSRFTLVNRAGESVNCETTLLGRHNISNVVLCCLAAEKLGLTMSEIARGVKLIRPVEHRLQLLPGELNVIDDAFNSNPAGAKEALNVLHSFPGRHLIITPGFVEMGADENKFNYEFGRQIAKSADAVILVGPKHTRPILQGLLKEGFDKDSVLTVNTLDEASKNIRRFVSGGDAVLFENDLPDNYAE